MHLKSIFEAPVNPATLKDSSQKVDAGRIQKPQPSEGPAPLSPSHSVESPGLPITKKKSELISFIENNSVVIIRGATGSGKTTQLPQFILDHYNEKNVTCNIVVTQPRKIGATSIARWVAAQRKCTLGSQVGYQIGLEKMTTEHTRLIYMTTGVLLQKLVQAKSLTGYSHIFVDEVHERTEEMDFLLLVLRKLLHSNSRHVKIILMSATINCDEFARYFATLIRGKMSPAYVFEVEGTPYATEEFYIEDIQKLHPHGFELPNPDDPHIPLKMYDLAINLIHSFDEMEGKDFSKAEADGRMTLSERGSVLVFLPGLQEIRCMQEALSKLVHQRPLTPDCYPDAAQWQPTADKRVILSTNISESSVTVPDVKYVIDFCLARQLVYDKETNYQCLRLTWASKSNCNQRKGRAGRVSKGYCYRLVTKHFWRNEIPEYMTPGMQLAPLSNILLKVKLLDMGDPLTLLSKALSPPNLSDIVRTVLQLIEMGALSAKADGGSQSQDGELTFLGRVIASLPVDLYLGKMIVLGHVFGCLDECLIIAASHSLRTFFAIPAMQQLAGHRSKLAFAHGTPSDSIAILNAFRAWYSAKKNGQLRHPKDELSWGRENFIQIKRIREVAELYEDLKKRVALFNMHVPEDPQSLDNTSTHRQKFILQVVIAGAFYPNYFFQQETDERLACKELNGLNPRTTVMVRNLPPYSFLYYKQLQSLFRLCGQVKTVTFDCSRAYVEFQRTSKDSGVLPEVLLSLLMAQKSFPLDMSVYSSDQIEMCAGRRSVTHLRYSRLKADIQRQSLSLMDSVSTKFNPGKLPPSRLFVVNITEVMDVGHFWGFPGDEASLEKQRCLTSEINKCTMSPMTVSLYPNLVCLAPFSESNEESLYYRAKILHISGNNVEVFFLDFGNTAVVSSSSLRELPSDLLSEPYQAWEFQVVGMRPSAQSIILGNQWSSRARDCFITMVKNQSVIVSLYSILYGVMRVELLINKDSKSTSVVDILVEEGYAVKAEESFDSQQSHEDLRWVYNEMEKGTYVPTAVSCSMSEQKEQDEEMIHSLLTQLSSGHKSYCKKNVNLLGPWSPYQTKFHSLSRKTYYRTVSIDRSSINHFTLNENPHFKHHRMLVAAKVAVNPSATQILLNDTSLLPDIPGLPSLVMMLFTPVLELRTNEEQSYYTGALCGLGFDEVAQKPILPENDIELAFDVKLDNKDVVEINTLRSAINSLLCNGPSSTLHLSQKRIRQLQQDCGDRLTRLFIRTPPRPAVTPAYLENQWKWNQVDPSHRMVLAEQGGGNVQGGLFQLHSPIVLNR
ncbi:PREDICTED: putative ATP-dependent RNA helicase TDRD9 [Cyprinodon variegatus]|uniref:putative ATP-dependent RNA helicase TDRD9 n=1 Tax=Cyprinodon variegatus TaxID=28743 RepID=UPI0007425B72|nr:PREDICTED: putative ATP-dependent RNA helicase TDRD9 [Cyprinodon variegatus]